MDQGTPALAPSASMRSYVYLIPNFTGTIPGKSNEGILHAINGKLLEATYGTQDTQGTHRIVDIFGGVSYEPNKPTGDLPIRYDIQRVVQHYASQVPSSGKMPVLVVWMTAKSGWWTSRYLSFSNSSHLPLLEEINGVFTTGWVELGEFLSTMGAEVTVICDEANLSDEMRQSSSVWSPHVVGGHQYYIFDTTRLSVENQTRRSVTLSTPSTEPIVTAGYVDNYSFMDHMGGPSHRNVVAVTPGVVVPAEAAHMHNQAGALVLSGISQETMPHDVATTTNPMGFQYTGVHDLDGSLSQHQAYAMPILSSQGAAAATPPYITGFMKAPGGGPLGLPYLPPPPIRDHTSQYVSGQVCEVGPSKVIPMGSPPMPLQDATASAAPNQSTHTSTMSRPGSVRPKLRVRSRQTLPSKRGLPSPATRPQLSMAQKVAYDSPSPLMMMTPENKNTFRTLGPIGIPAVQTQPISSRSTSSGSSSPSMFKAPEFSYSVPTAVPTPPAHEENHAGPSNASPDELSQAHSVSHIPETTVEPATMKRAAAKRKLDDKYASIPRSAFASNSEWAREAASGSSSTTARGHTEPPKFFVSHTSGAFIAEASGDWDTNMKDKSILKRTREDYRKQTGMDLLSNEDFTPEKKRRKTARGPSQPQSVSTSRAAPRAKQLNFTFLPLPQ